MLQNRRLMTLLGIAVAILIGGLTWHTLNRDTSIELVYTLTEPGRIHPTREAPATKNVVVALDGYYHLAKVTLERLPFAQADDGQYEWWYLENGPDAVWELVGAGDDGKSRRLRRFTVGRRIPGMQRADPDADRQLILPDRPYRLTVVAGAKSGSIELTIPKADAATQ